MRDIQPPDAIGMALLVLSLAVVLLLVGTVVTSELGIRLVIAGSCQLVIFAITVLWWTARGIRLQAFRFYYRFFGPICQIRIIGNIPVNPKRGDKELLSRVLQIVKTWNPDADRVADMRNRNVITAGARTLTVDTRGDVVDEDQYNGAGYEYEARIEVESWEDYEYPTDREVVFNLGGYEGKLTRMDLLLEHEISHLLGRFNGDIKREDAQSMYSLRATIQSSNPFLVFYLRDVPASNIQEFGLSFKEGAAEEQVSVTVTGNYINISARTPTRLLETARKYLASPSLAVRG